MTTTTIFTNIDSPIGSLLLYSRGRGLAGVVMEQQRYAATPDGTWIEDHAFFTEAHRQIDEYFAGTRTAFDLELDPQGTPFQLRVWEALRAIPIGETVSYAELAARIGMPKGPRAVGHANARNPHAVVVPCHRVIGANGSLTGYAGGEDRKRWLLDHERRVNTRRVSAGSSSWGTTGPGAKIRSSIAGNFTTSSPPTLGT
jgi:methylated-DNA-[protein]-cysteine S-methyltransferase